MFNWIARTFRKILVWLIILQIKMFEKKEFRPLLVKYLEFKIGIITKEQLNMWFSEEIYEA